MSPDATVDITYPPEAEAFRIRIRAFLAEHLPAGWPGPGALPPAEREAFGLRWRQALSASGLVAVSWPTEYGGGGLSAIEQVVLAEEFARAGAPERAENDLLGHRSVGQHADRVGVRGAEEAFPATHPHR